MHLKCVCLLVVLPALTIARSPGKYQSEEFWPNERHPVKERIVGGQRAEAVLPYMASLQVLFKGQWIDYCSGAIISETQVLTAAHCALDYADLPKSVLVGSVSITAGDRYKVTKHISHPKFKAVFPYANDIAVLVVTPSFNVSNPAIKPIAMSPRNIEPNETVTVAGWGKLTRRPHVEDEDEYYEETPGRGVDYPDTLQKLDQTTMRNEECEAKWAKQSGIDKYKPGEVLKTSQLCAYKKTGTCEGDSGSPLVSAAAGKDPELIGIVTFGTAECGGMTPDVYTRVAPFLPFIHEAMGKSKP